MITREDVKNYPEFEKRQKGVNAIVVDCQMLSSRHSWGLFFSLGMCLWFAIYYWLGFLTTK